MASRRENTRLALEAEGATAEEVAEALADIDAEENGRDQHARARRAGVPALYLGVEWDHLELDDGRKLAILAARNWANALLHLTDDELAERRQSREQPPPVEDVLERIAAGDSSFPMPRGLYLWSEGDADEDLTGFGTGKTRIAAAAAQQIVNSGNFDVRWLDVVRLMTDLNRPFSSSAYGRAADRLRQPDAGELIVLDDIDKQPPTDRNLQPIFALVNDCVNGEVPLLITANRNPDDLAEDWGARFGHAVASRIIGHCLDVEVSGRDRRLSGAA